MHKVTLDTKIFPLVLKAYKRSEVELELNVENKSENFLWIEITVNVPNLISLSNVKDLSTGLVRLGIFRPGQKKQKKIKIYSHGRTYPDEYVIDWLMLSYDEEAVLFERGEGKLHLRAVDEYSK
ncbi:MAG: hypothetical protein N3E37_03945 [Candidatus Micrarchaeota archaeon]|nr:hypothetical protein [Candidatus Micrarchaeota archaeon]